jgi:urease alpha subunit
LKDFKHEVLIFVDANKNETHHFQGQTHDVRFVTKHGFHVNWSIGGSLHAFMRNCGQLNMMKDLREGTPPNTHNRGSQQIDFFKATSRLFQDIIEQAGF